MLRQSMVTNSALPVSTELWMRLNLALEEGDSCSMHDTIDACIVQCFERTMTANAYLILNCNVLHSMS